MWREKDRNGVAGQRGHSASQPFQVCSSSSEQGLELILGQPSISSTSGAMSTHQLGDRAFDHVQPPWLGSSSHAHFSFEGIGARFTAARLNDRMMLIETQVTPTRFIRAQPRSKEHAVLALHAEENMLRDQVLRVGLGYVPVGWRTVTRTNGQLLFHIDVEIFQTKAGWLAGGIGLDETIQLNAALAAGDEIVGAHVPLVDVLLAGRKPTRCQPRLQRRQVSIVNLRRRCDGHIRDETCWRLSSDPGHRTGCIDRFRHLQFIAHPARITFVPIAHLGIVRRSRNIARHFARRANDQRLLINVAHELPSPGWTGFVQDALQLRDLGQPLLRYRAVRLNLCQQPRGLSLVGLPSAVAPDCAPDRMLRDDRLAAIWFQPLCASVGSAPAGDCAFGQSSLAATATPRAHPHS